MNQDFLTSFIFQNLESETKVFDGETFTEDITDDDSFFSGLPQDTQQKLTMAFKSIADTDEKEAKRTSLRKSGRRKQILESRQEEAKTGDPPKAKARGGEKLKRTFLYNLDPKEAKNASEARRWAKASKIHAYHEGVKQKIKNLEKENSELRWLYQENEKLKKEIEKLKEEQFSRNST